MGAPPFALALAGVLVASPLTAQAVGGSAASAWAGGALGLTAGGLLGGVGGILPCTETTWGSRCVAATAVVVGAVGATSGAVLGAADSETLTDRAVSSGVGTAVGVAVALAGRPFFPRVGWPDVATVGLLGGAVASQPRGAAIGAGAGALAGLLLWPTLPGFEMPDAVAAVLAGVVIGVTTGWVRDAVDARGPDAPPAALFALRLSV